MSGDDPRRRIPRTDTLLRRTEFVDAAARHGATTIKAAVAAAQQRARAGEIAPEEVAAAALDGLPARATSLRPVINATGVVVHTNIGRAPLSAAAVEAVRASTGYVDVEFDLVDGRRAPRGGGALDALRAAVPAAEDVFVVNNGAAALVLATTALAAGREILVSRGEMVEIGDGFRLPDLVASSGARLHEVGTTNRTTLRDYTTALGPDTGCILKVHPSNFRMEGFTSSVPLTALRDLGVPVVMDVGSGLLAPEPILPDEPDVTTCLEDGASIVTASGDKLLGGPQAGLVLGQADLVTRLRRHPLARALRVDKLTLAALEATLRGPTPPVTAYLRADRDWLLTRTRALAEALGRPIVAVEGRVGGGGAPGVPLPGYAVALPEACASALRRHDPAVLARVGSGRCLVDLRCVERSDDELLERTLREVLSETTDAGD